MPILPASQRLKAQGLFGVRWDWRSQPVLLGYADGLWLPRMPPSKRNCRPLMIWHGIAVALCLLLAIWAILSAEWVAAFAFATGALAWANTVNIARLKREMRRRGGDRLPPDTGYPRDGGP